jgi:SnoaL-like domain
MESSSGTDLVRRAYDEWNWYGSEAFGRFLSESVTLDDAPELPDAGRWQGREAVLERLDAVAEAVGGGWVEIRAVEQLGDEVLVDMLWRLDDAGEGVPVGEVFHLVALEGGKLASIRVFRSREEAQSAAGGSNGP